MPPSPLSSESDSQLSSRIRAGDLVAFETVFRAHSLSVLRFGIRLLGDRDAAEDLVQEVFSWVWEHRATWNPAGDVRIYLLSAARNRALNVLRDTKRRTGIVSRADAVPGVGELPVAPDVGIEQRERAERVRKVLEGLSEPQRTVLYLRWRHGLGWPEIAGVLDVSTDAIKKQHSRILTALRELFRDL